MNRGNANQPTDADIGTSAVKCFVGRAESSRPDIVLPVGPRRLGPTYKKESMTTTTLEELTRVVAAMPADAAKQVLDFARFLEQQRNRQIEYADWDDESMRAATLESMRRYNEENPEDEGYDDLAPR